MKRHTAKTVRSTTRNRIETYTITAKTPEGETRVQVDEDEYILDVFLDEGFNLPYKCRQGWCITCAARLLEGEVDVSDARRYYEEDQEAGFVLLCSAKPRSDCVIRTHRKKAMIEHRSSHNLPAPRG